MTFYWMYQQEVASFANYLIEIGISWGECILSNRINSSFNFLTSILHYGF